MVIPAAKRAAHLQAAARRKGAQWDTEVAQGREAGSSYMLVWNSLRTHTRNKVHASRTCAQEKATARITVPAALTEGTCPCSMQPRWRFHMESHARECASFWSVPAQHKTETSVPGASPAWLRLGAWLHPFLFWMPCTYADLPFEARKQKPKSPRMLASTNTVLRAPGAPYRYA